MTEYEKRMGMTYEQMRMNRVLAFRDRSVYGICGKFPPIVSEKKGILDKFRNLTDDEKTKLSKSLQKFKEENK